jgi:hypothetical protein
MGLYSDNIPVGFDENGTYRGNGQWYDDDEAEYSPQEDDKYDALQNVQSGHFVECLLCGKIVNIKDSEQFAAGYLCKLCAKEKENAKTS